METTNEPLYLSEIEYGIVKDYWQAYKFYFIHYFLWQNFKNDGTECWGYVLTNAKLLCV
jgi:hypothetical protein